MTRRRSGLALVFLSVLVLCGDASASRDPRTLEWLLTDSKGLAFAIEEKATTPSEELLASILRNGADVLMKAYSPHLLTDRGKLPKEPMRVADSVEKLLNDVRAADKKGPLAARAQSVFVQLLDRLPASQRRPVLLGVKTPEGGSGETEIVGFLLVDPKAGSKKPELSIDGAAIDAGRLTVGPERIRVKLTDEELQKLGAPGSACEPKRLSGVKVTSTYRGAKADDKATLSIIPADNPFELTVQFSATDSSYAEEWKPFSQMSATTEAPCGAVRNDTVTFELPAGVTEARASAEWVDANDKVRNQTAQAVVQEGKVVATGSFRGPELTGREPNTTCAGNGQATLRVKGNYKVKSNPQRPVSFDLPGAPPSLGPAIDAFVRFELPTAEGEGRTVKGVTLTLRRRGCPKAIDSVSLTIPADGKEVSGTSSGGVFTATLGGRDIQVKRLKRTD